MNFEHIIYEVEDGIATITLNRPEVFNAFNGFLRLEVIAAFDLVDQDDDVGAVIITGAGRAFCGGADVSNGASIFDKNDKKPGGTALRPDGTFDYSHPAARDGGGVMALRIFNCLKPVIGAINGAAAGVGASMTLPMDIRIGTDKARMGFVYARRGIVNECCSSWFLPRVVGISKALQWSFSGRIIPAAELLSAGLLSEIVAPEELLPRAREIAREIIDNTSTVSIALMRQMLWRILGMSHPMEAHEVESRGICSRGRSPDAKEGVKSFLEKRPPHFPGKVSQDMPDYFPWWTEPEYK